MNRRARVTAGLLAMLAPSMAATAAKGPRPQAKAVKAAADRSATAAAKPDSRPEKSLYDYTLPGTDGRSIPISSYRGKVLLVVNLARNSSYNAQLSALDRLSKDFGGKGLVVLGVPSNDFGAEEPGSDADVQKYYAGQKVSFPVMAVSPLLGVHELPLYSFLTTGKSVPAGGAVHWNYTKFLVNGKGEVVARFDSDVAPDSPQLVSAVEQVLAGTYAPPKKKDGEHPGEADKDDDED